MIRRIFGVGGALALAGCPEMTFTNDGMWQCWPETRDQVVGGDGAAVVAVDSDADGTVWGTQYLNNRGGEDCPVAVYVGGWPPELDDAPALTPGEAPPEAVDGLGRLVYAALLAPGSSAIVDWSGPLPVFVTVIGCPGLELPGTVLNAPCGSVEPRK